MGLKPPPVTPAGVMAALEAFLTEPGDMLLRGAGSVGVLPTGDEDEVLTVVDGLPFWDPPAAPGSELAILTTRGDLVRRGAAAPERVALGAAGTVLGSDGTDAIWRNMPTQLNGVLSTRGDLLRRGAATSERLALGAAHQRLVSDGTDAVWAAIKGCELAVGPVTIGDGAATLISFTAADVTDTDAFHNPASNSSRIVIPAGLGGWYAVTASFDHAGDASTAGIRRASLEKNAGGVTGGGVVLSRGTQSTGGTGANQGSVNMAWLGKLAAADYLEVFYFQNSGGNRSVSVVFSLAFLGS